MNRLIRYMQTYLVVSVPLVVACIARSPSPTQTMQWDMLSWNLMLWFALLIVYLMMLVTMPTVRETTLVRLANLKERDEREEYITGKASRTAYISSLSLMIFFLFFSIFTFSLYRSPLNDSQHYTMSISANLNEHASANDESGTSKEVIFSSSNFTPSAAIMIFILIGWQLLSFNLKARKEKM